MSKGPGRVARAIVAALEAAPTNALTTQELCERCYEPPITKKHRVAVLRALKQVMARRDDIATMASEGLGSQMVTYWRYDITSYAMARLKAANHNHYRSNDLRVYAHQCKTARQLMASLRKGGSHHHLVVKGGLWWDYVQLEIAVRDGDRKQVKLLQAKAAKRRAATFKKLVRTQGS